MPNLAGNLAGGGSPVGAAGGDLSGTYPNPAVAALTESGGQRLPLGAVADLQLLRRSGAGVAGVANTMFAAAYFTCYAVGNQLWNATVWTGFHGVPSVGITNVLAQGISRTNSAFDVTVSGTYRWSARFNTFANPGGYWGMRLHDGTATKWQFSTWQQTSANIHMGLDAVIDMVAGTPVSLEYCTGGGTPTTYTAGAALNGETQRSGYVVINRIG